MFYNVLEHSAPLYKPTQTPPEELVIIVPWPCEHVLLKSKIKPVMWQINSHLVIILAVGALRRFRGDLRGSTARIDIAVSVTCH